MEINCISYVWAHHSTFLFLILVEQYWYVLLPINITFVRGIEIKTLNKSKYKICKSCYMSYLLMFKYSLPRVISLLLLILFFSLSFEIVLPTWICYIILYAIEVGLVWFCTDMQRNGLTSSNFILNDASKETEAWLCYISIALHSNEVLDSFLICCFFCFSFLKVDWSFFLHRDRYILFMYTYCIHNGNKSAKWLIYYWRSDWAPFYFILFIRTKDEKNCERMQKKLTQINNEVMKSM